MECLVCPLFEKVADDVSKLPDKEIERQMKIMFDRVFLFDSDREFSKRYHNFLCFAAVISKVSILCYRATAAKQRKL